MKRCFLKDNVKDFFKCIWKTIKVFYISIVYSPFFIFVRKFFWAKKKSKETVFVGVSGGVDSSVSALLLKKKYNIVGVFIKVYQPETVTFCWRNELLDAKKVCKQLKIPFIFFNLEKDYKKNIFDYMIKYYKQGLTPNPDVFCNKFIKFGTFLDKSIQIGADYIAMGHYAQNKYNKEKEVFELKRGSDKSKDQSYFLSSVTQRQLSKAIFPIGEIDKKEVREIAKKNNLFNANKKDSQGLCFIGKISMRDFLKDFIEEKKGDVLNLEGKKIGNHIGAEFYTIGERHGFNIFKEFQTPNSPKLFVVKKDIEKNTITVSEREVNGKNILEKKQIYIKNINFISINDFDYNQTYQTMIRYRGRVVDSKIEKIEKNKYRISFIENQTAVSSGQILVFYKNNTCLGEGEIVV